MLLPIIVLVSCSTIRETVVVNADQSKVREAIAQEVLSKGGIIKDDSDYSVTTDMPSTNTTHRFLSGSQFMEWIYNVSGSSPTRLVLVPYFVQGYQRSQVGRADSGTLGAVQQSLTNIKSAAESTHARR
jgi:hypothetical protein